MPWYDDQPVTTPPPAPEPAPRSEVARGLRRGVLTAALAAVLLVGGGVAAVAAASPDPSGTPAPSTQADGSDDGSTVQPDDQRQGHPGCEDRDGGGSQDGTRDGASSTDA